MQVFVSLHGIQNGYGCLDDIVTVSECFCELLPIITIKQKKKKINK